MSIIIDASGRPVFGAGGAIQRPGSVVSGQTLLTAADLTYVGAFGSVAEGPADGTSTSGGNTMNYASGLSFLRSVGGNTRVVMPTGNGNQLAGLTQGWAMGDLIEMSIPGTLSTTRASQDATLNAATATRRWLKNDWQGIGAKEASSGIVPGGSWWDEANDILWYQVFPYYSDGPYAHLFAVKLNDPVSGTIGTCTRYGPWIYGTSWTEANWKRTAMHLTEIPTDKRSALGNRTHLIGASVMSVGGPGHWGLGLTAVNLPATFAEISGTNCVGTSGSAVLTITTAAHDLTTVPTDGTAAIFVCFSDTRAAIYTIPSSIIKSGDVYTVTGSVTLTAGQAGAANPCYWSVVKQWGDAGIHLADFTQATSGKTFPYNHMGRPTDYQAVAGTYLVGDDPYLPTRVSLGTANMSQNGLLPQAVTSTTVTLHSSASATDGFYVGKFLTWDEPPNAADYLHWKSPREITAYNGTTKVATLDAAFNALYTPTTADKYTIKSDLGVDTSSWDSASTAMPAVIGADGFWQASIDAQAGMVFLSGATKHGVIYFGREAYGGTWYRYWDTYAHHNKVALSMIPDSGSLAFCAERIRPVIWRYDPDHLGQVVAATRAKHRDGMAVVNLGSWYDKTGTMVWQFKGATAGSYPSVDIKDKTYWFQYPAEGNCAAMLWDAANSRIIWTCPQQYWAGSIYYRLPLFIVFSVDLG